MDKPLLSEEMLKSQPQDPQPLLSAITRSFTELLQRIQEADACMLSSGNAPRLAE